MIQLVTMNNNQPWSEDEFIYYLSFIPNEMIDSIMAYKDWQGRQARILSKVLIKKQIELFKLNLQLTDLKKNAWNKSFFEANFNLSISHSHQLVACIASDKGLVGLDIEWVDENRTEYPTELFSDNECAYLKISNTYNYDFYKLFTRKEALSKLIGNGILFDFKNYDTMNDELSFENKTYYFKTMVYFNVYMLSYLSEKNRNIEIKHIDYQ